MLCDALGKSSGEMLGTLMTLSFWALVCRAEFIAIASSRKKGTFPRKCIALAPQQKNSSLRQTPIRSPFERGTRATS